MTREHVLESFFCLAAQELETFGSAWLCGWEVYLKNDRFSARQILTGDCAGPFDNLTEAVQFCLTHKVWPNQLAQALERVMANALRDESLGRHAPRSSQQLHIPLIGTEYMSGGDAVKLTFANGQEFFLLVRKVETFPPKEPA